jgi:hypothetical protein
MAAEAGFDLKIRHRVRHLLKQGDGEYQLYLIGWSGRSDPDGNSHVFQTCNAPRTTASIATRRSTPPMPWRPRATSPTARRPTRSWRRNFAEASVLYIYHRRVLVALSDKVEGYKQMPDGLVRVVGVKLKQRSLSHPARLLQIIPTLILVSMPIFGLQQFLPGDPALIMAGEERDPKVLEEIRQQYR